MDSPCFSNLIEKYNKKVYNLAYHITGSRQDAEDAVQETFLQVYKHLDDFRGDSSIYTWIYRITVNICFQLKKQNDKAYVENLEEKIDLYRDKIPFPQQANNSNPEEAVLINEITKVIRNECQQIVMRKLPEKQRIVFVMRVVLDLSYQEISDTLGISENVIKARLHRARISLLSHFQNKCQWYIQGEPSSCCREKAGYILTQDTEALKRVFEGMKDCNSDNENANTSEQECQKLEQIYKQVQIPHQKPSVELIKNYVFQA
ncbi:RNA polymerase sigma factor [Metallumcola ferriviriculae]|uniref:RNA polymerase sigma factor n=1 Tax=Metallumcola ferriviriculae TaxID=3039180 RepID=A0AAU0UPB1_9FIRM|nr:RNA polymerase sigma factor [Desulfitibacteraceae bacterium MK1]